MSFVELIEQAKRLRVPDARHSSPYEIMGTFTPLCTRNSQNLAEWTTGVDALAAILYRVQFEDRSLSG